MVENKLGVGVLLQERRRDRRCHIAFNGSGHDGCFVFAKCQQQNFASFQDGSHTHRDGSTRNVFNAEKVACCVNAGQAVERNQTCLAVSARTRFIKADMPGATDAEDLYIDTTDRIDFGFILATPIGDLFNRDGAVGDVDVFFRNVDMIEQVLSHKTNVTLQAIRLHREVFVQVEGDHIRE